MPVVTKLTSLYMTKSLANRLYLKKKLYMYYMGLGTKLGDYINEFNKLILDLANIDIEIEDEDQALMLLTSFPSSYENFIDTLLYGRESLTMEYGNAYFGEALVVVENDEMTELVMDLGGSYHMKPRRDFLYDFKGFDGASVQLGDNKTCVIRGTGKAKIQLHYGSSIILEDVRCVRGLRRSLISIVAQRQLEDKQLEEKTNTNILVKEHEKVHLGIKVEENIMITRVPRKEGAEGNCAKKEKGEDSMESNQWKLQSYNFGYSRITVTGTRMIRTRPPVEGDGWEPKWL
ncbi:hypothetical protein Tco_0097287 [Tanacetum coccineum]